jgi:hypothetical protein
MPRPAQALLPPLDLLGSLLFLCLDLTVWWDPCSLLRRMKRAARRVSLDPRSGLAPGDSQRWAEAGRMGSLGHALTALLPVRQQTVLCLWLGGKTVG